MQTCKSDKPEQKAPTEISGNIHARRTLGLPTAPAICRSKPQTHHRGVLLSGGQSVPERESATQTLQETPNPSGMTMCLTYMRKGAWSRVFIFSRLPSERACLTAHLFYANPHVGWPLDVLHRMAQVKRKYCGDGRQFSASHVHRFTVSSYVLPHSQPTKWINYRCAVRACIQG